MNDAADHWIKQLSHAALQLSADIRLMEVCGSHSVAVARAGIRELLPPNVTLLSGPGCPVCVASAAFIDKAAALARKGVKLHVFGDLLKIPGSTGTLRGEANVKVVYSPDEVLEAAQIDPEHEHVFAAVGFEPTAAVCAALLDGMKNAKITNLSCLTDLKHLRPVLDGLIADSNIDGFLLPGHVAAITGEAGFAELQAPGVIAGFEPEDILKALRLLIDMVAAGENTKIANLYTQVVKPQGNTVALELMARCFDKSSGEWRGIGTVANGCYTIKSDYAEFDANHRYRLNTMTVSDNSDCRCSEILRGHIMPENCPLFGGECTPAHPIGACMVSGEGACMAAFHYRRSV